MKKLFCLMALVGTAAAAAAQAPVLKASGDPKAVDFKAHHSKRADIRVMVSKLGWDAAFTQWLKSERPHIYASRIAALEKLQRSANKEAVAKR